jgi:hypothetical protein
MPNGSAVNNKNKEFFGGQKKVKNNACQAGWHIVNWGHDE